MSQGAPSKHSLEAFLALLRAVDAALEGPAEVTVIGGTAVSFIDPTHATTDIDCLVGSPAAWQAFAKACERAKAATGLDIPIQNVGIAHLPESFEDRLELWKQPFSKLKVRVPERHDLVIAKLARGWENDIQAAVDIHKAAPLLLPVLVERYKETYVTGRREAFKISFLDFVTRAFGDAEASRLDADMPP